MANTKILKPEEIKEKLSSITWDQDNPYVQLFLKDPVGFIKSFETLFKESDKVVKSVKQITDALQLFSSEEKLTPKQVKFLETPLSGLDISVRAFNCLKFIIENIIVVSSKHFTVADIIEKIPISILAKKKNLGKKTICDLQNYFADHGFYLKEDIPGYEIKRRAPLAHLIN